MKTTVKTIIFLFIFTLSFIGKAQNEGENEEIITTSTTECANDLLQAQKAYQEGRILEVEEIISRDCLEGSDLTNDEKVIGYRLLTLVYLNMNEPEKADAMFLKLINLNPEYRINELDPTEFINFYNTYRTWPIFKIAPKAGSSISWFNNTNQFPVHDYPRINTLTPGFQGGITFEFDLSRKFLKGQDIRDFWVLNLDAYFSSKRYISTYEENNLFTEDTQLQTRYDYNAADIRAIMNYRIFPTKQNDKKNKKFYWYAQLGIAGEYMTGIYGVVQEGQREGNAGTNFEEPRVNLIDKFYSKFNFQAITGTSLRYKIGLSWLTADIKYHYYPIDTYDNSKAYSNSLEIGSTGAYVLNNGQLQNLSLSVGITVPIYVPKKLTEK